MHVMLAQINPKVGDLDGNTKKILEWIDRGVKEEVDLIVFPELAISGYPPEDLLLHEVFIEAIEQHLEQIVNHSQGIACIVGLPRKNLSRGEKNLLNSMAVIQNGALLGFQDKCLLPTYDVFDEKRYFEPGGELHLWKVGDLRLAMTICEDIWQHAGYIGATRYSRDPVEELAQLQPDLMINISASPYQLYKPDMRINVCKKAAKTLKCPVAMCCQVGANDQIVFDGYSTHVNLKGELVQIARGFEEDTLEIYVEESYKPIAFHYDPMKNLYQALKVGLRDYLHKSRFTKGCFGISGGIDSAVVACIAKDALGAENVMGVWMPSMYSSKESEEDAKKICQNLDVECVTIPIDDVFKSFLATMSPHFKNRPADVTEENLQARIRGNILMALSNKFGYIVLSTGNKSEVAMGYCTLYGDMCGGLDVLGDVMKTQVYKLARYINDSAGSEIIPKRVFDKAPSAELRFNQKDTDSLPEYAVVDVVLEGYVEDYVRVDAIAQKHGIPLEDVLNLVRKIHQAEYKRRQGSPVIRVSKKSFGVGRRYPIVQGWM